MADGSPTATIKYGKGYDDSWFVATGSPAEIKQQVTEYFGLDAESVKDKTPHEVVLEGQQIAQGTASVASQLNGSIATDWPSSQDKPASKSKWSGAKKKSEPKEEKKEHPNGEILARIEGAKSEDELKAIFATNREAFTADDVKAASKAKFAQLKESN